MRRVHLGMRASCLNAHAGVQTCVRITQCCQAGMVTAQLLSTQPHEQQCASTASGRDALILLQSTSIKHTFAMRSSCIWHICLIGCGSLLQAHKVCPSDPLACNELGVLTYRNQQYSASEQWLLRALELVPGRLNAGKALFVLLPACMLADCTPSLV